LTTLEAVQSALGTEGGVMVDYSQALDTAEALSRRHMIDDHELKNRLRRTTCQDVRSWRRN
jgi:hypothetical protein